MNKELDKILDHSYDGIQEFDNPLPRWWLLTFYGAIVFAAIYFSYYHIGTGPSPEQELASDLTAIKELEARSLKEVPPPSPEQLEAVFQDPKNREAGKAIFSGKCASCHGQSGEGQIGPNLTDDYWIHGDGSMSAVFTVVSTGVPEKGMPPWGNMLKREEILAVVSYVHSLDDTHPASPKAPQGVKIHD